MKYLVGEILHWLSRYHGCNADANVMTIFASKRCPSRRRRGRATSRVRDRAKRARDWQGILSFRRMQSQR